MVLILLLLCLGSDHLPLRDTLKDAKVPPFLTSRRAKKRKAKQSPTAHSPDSRKKSSPLPKTNKGGKPAESESASEYRVADDEGWEI